MKIVVASDVVLIIYFLAVPLICDQNNSRSNANKKKKTKKAEKQKNKLAMF